MLDLGSIKKDLDSLFVRLSSDVSLLHSQRATPALIENILVPAYGQKMPLKELASLTTPDARTIIVQPWDASVLGEIQNAIFASQAGFGMSVEEKFIRLTMPQLSDERRKEVIRQLGKRVEESRISVRRVRDVAMKSIEESEKKKEISEDQKFRDKESIQKVIDEYNKKILDLESRKIKDIETIS